MNSISITAFNRPEHLKQVVNSILANNTTGFTHCFCAIEPERAEENHRELLRLQERFEQVEYIFNPVNLGVRKNPFNLLQNVFEPSKNIDFNLYLEDDSLLSPDAFDFVRFYMKTMLKPNVICCNLYNYESNPNFPDLVFANQKFCALGFGITKRQWKDFFEIYWNDEDIRIRNNVDIGGKGGWDWSIRAAMKEFSKSVVKPVLSRSFHLGVEGVHCDFQCWNKEFKDHPYSHYKKTEFTTC